MYSNSDCTIYLPDATGYCRHVVADVFWDDIRSQNFNRTGSRDIDSARVFIWMDKIALPLKVDKAYIIKGMSEIDVKDSDNLTVLLKAGALTITSIAKRDFGSPIMQHWEIGAK